MNLSEDQKTEKMINNVDIANEILSFHMNMNILALLVDIT